MIDCKQQQQQYDLFTERFNHEIHNFSDCYIKLYFSLFLFLHSAINIHLVDLEQEDSNSVYALLSNTTPQTTVVDEA